MIAGHAIISIRQAFSSPPPIKAEVTDPDLCFTGYSGIAEHS